MAAKTLPLSKRGRQHQSMAAVQPDERGGAHVADEAVLRERQRAARAGRRRRRRVRGELEPEVRHRPSITRAPRGSCMRPVTRPPSNTSSSIACASSAFSASPSRRRAAGARPARGLPPRAAGRCGAGRRHPDRRERRPGAAATPSSWCGAAGSSRWARAPASRCPRTHRAGGRHRPLDHSRPHRRARARRALGAAALSRLGRHHRARPARRLDSVLRLRERVNLGAVAGPRIYSAGRDDRRPAHHLSRRHRRQQPARRAQGGGPPGQRRRGPDQGLHPGRPDTAPGGARRSRHLQSPGGRASRPDRRGDRGRGGRSARSST